MTIVNGLTIWTEISSKISKFDIFGCFKFKQPNQMTIVNALTVWTEISSKISKYNHDNIVGCFKFKASLSSLVDSKFDIFDEE